MRTFKRRLLCGAAFVALVFSGLFACAFEKKAQPGGAYDPNAVSHDVSGQVSAQDNEAYNNRLLGKGRTHVRQEALNAAIKQAVLAQDASHRKEPNAISCESHVILAQEAARPENGAQKAVVVYAIILSQELVPSDDGMENPTGSMIPSALTFDVMDDGTYKLREYWVPRDGSFYGKDIRAKFPATVVSEALDLQRYSTRLTQSNYAQAIRESGMDPNPVVGRLIDRVASADPAVGVASSPKAYIDAGSLDYRELLYFGDYTLKYCFGEFLKGGQTDLRGQIMQQLIKDLAPDLLPSMVADTGQKYFDQVLAVVERKRSTHGDEWLKLHMPKAWTLIELKDKGR